MPRTILCSETLRFYSVRCGNDILYARVARSRGIAEVQGRLLCLRGDLRLPRFRRRLAGVIGPNAGEDIRRIAGGLALAVAVICAAGYTLAILGDAIRPRTAACMAIEALDKRRLAARVTTPLRTPEH